MNWVSLFILEWIRQTLQLNLKALQEKCVNASFFLMKWLATLQYFDGIVVHSSTVICFGLIFPNFSILFETSNRSFNVVIHLRKWLNWFLRAHYWRVFLLLQRKLMKRMLPEPRLSHAMTFIHFFKYDASFQILFGVSFRSGCFPMI